MAAATLVLNVPQKVTFSADAGKLREVILPVGATSVKMSSSEAFYLQVSGVDEEAETTTAQFKYAAGVFMEPIWTGGDVPYPIPLSSALSVYFIGASVSQAVWFHAVSR